MTARRSPLREHARTLAWSTSLAIVVGVLAGLASAIFLSLLDRATSLRLAHESLVYALPLAGLAIGAFYERFGKPIHGGTNLLLDAIASSRRQEEEASGASAPVRAQVPLRMAPLVLVGTVLTHLFGGSAGREGTAVQMGGSLASAVASRFAPSARVHRHLLVAGIAGGFGAVFGTPIAGAIFGVEATRVGRPEIAALPPALVAAFVGDRVTRAIGIAHTHYPSSIEAPLTFAVIAKLVPIGLAMALATLAFVILTERLKALFAKALPRLPLRMLVAGIAIVVLWKVSGTSLYLGLGVPTILAAFSDPTLPASAFALKLLFTSITLSGGFLGGEVTPLFFVGATLGALLARLLDLPLALGASVGLAAVFGAASNAPLGLTVMVAELVGPAVLPHTLLVTLLAFLALGHRGIYPSQRFARTKFGRRLPADTALRELAQTLRW